MLLPSRLGILGHLLIPLSLFLLNLSNSAQAYIPALPTNDTNAVNRTDVSRLSFFWVEGSYSADISLQLTADANTSDFFPNYYAEGGVDRGALVYFSEDNVFNNDTTSTPWIAFVSCDQNSSIASGENDIFTLARDRGAMAALLYSNTSQGCILSPDYVQNFEKPLDVFSAKSKTDAQIIISQFEQHCAADFWGFSPSLLNSSYSSVTTLLNGTYPVTNTYVAAVLRAYNATSTDGQTAPTRSSSATPSSSGGGGGKKPGTSTALIILYCVVGVITLLFFVIILSGAIKACKNPDRYGPRRGHRVGVDAYPYNFDDPRLGGGPTEAQGRQTRTAGLARAIVDTFPIVSFVARSKRSSQQPLPSETSPSLSRHEKDFSRDGSAQFEMDGLASSADAPVAASGATGSRRKDSISRAGGGGAAGGKKQKRKSTAVGYPSPPDAFAPPSPHDDDEDDEFKNTPLYARDRSNSAASSSLLKLDDNPSALQVPTLSSQHVTNNHSSPSASPPSSRGQSIELGAAVGMGGGGPVVELEESEERCPICLLDFEEGDDLRVLPCSELHRFHKDCVDNWLVEVSAVCPLCRQDFSASRNPSTSSLPIDSLQAIQPPASRINRYLAGVRRNRRRKPSVAEGL